MGIWEIEDGRLYLLDIEGRGRIFNRQRFHEGRLALRRRLRQSYITPQQNGHMLKSLKEECYEPYVLSMTGLFGSESKAFASWYTGILFVPHGRLIRYVHMGYASVFEMELRIEVTEGVVNGVSEIRNRVPK
jgi:hypothetical protein